MGLAESRFWVVDVEGNGARPPEIVELAIVEVAELALTGRSKHWLIRPASAIQPMASRIHGLKDADVADSPSIDDVADDVMTWLDDAAIIGHNVRVEVDAIGRSIPDWSPRLAIDTLRLAKTLRPDLPSYGLGKLGAALERADEAATATGGRHHSALHDAVLTAFIFIDLVTGVTPSDRDAVLEAADVRRGRQERLL